MQFAICRKKIMLVFIFFGFFSCLKQSKITIENDFEKPQNGWGDNNILSEGGHSGKYFARSDGSNLFNPAYSMDLQAISEHKIKRIDLIAWIRIKESGAKANLVLSLDVDQKPVFYKGFSTDASAPHLNEWTRMYVSYDIPDTLGKSENLKVYFWNSSNLSVDADDVEIRLYY
jgi:hypothetical protein